MWSGESRRVGSPGWECEENWGARLSQLGRFHCWWWWVSLSWWKWVSLRWWKPAGTTAWILGKMASQSLAASWCHLERAGKGLLLEIVSWCSWVEKREERSLWEAAGHQVEDAGLGGSWEEMSKRWKSRHQGCCPTKTWWSAWMPPWRTRSLGGLRSC